MAVNRGTLAGLAGAGGIIDPGAEALMKMDAAIQALTRKIDSKVEAGLKSIKERDVGSPDITCVERQAAIAVSLAMKAVQYGSLKVALRVLPRMIESVVRSQIYGVIERSLAWVATTRALKKIPVLGNILSVLIGVAHEIDFNRELEGKIRDVLGCKESEIDGEPMRGGLNKIVAEMKTRTRDEPRPVGPVRTRHT